MFELNYYLESVLVGLILSDAYIQHNRSSTANYLIVLTQSYPKNLLFFINTYQILSPIILTKPVFKLRKRLNNFNYSLTF